MNSWLEAICQSWNFDRGALVVLPLIAWIYLRGWRRCNRIGSARLLSFFAGLTVLFLALASPLDAFARFLLMVHMTQHLLLTMVAPPLILLGAPFLPLLRGLPPKALKHGLGPFLAWPAGRRWGSFLTQPLLCWLIFAAATVFWHIPQFYELALRSDSWHEVEHLLFFGSALLFWLPVIQSESPGWAIIPYLLLADLLNTGLSAFLCFSERVVYPAYAAAPRISSLTALADQTGAGALMWLFGSLAYLVPAALLTVKMLSPRRAKRQTGFSAGKTRRPGEWDLLLVPILGAALRWRHFRRLAQTVMFILALTVIADGLFGHRMSSMNLAGILPWTHGRALAVIALLVGGNFFCMACPFVFARDLGRRVMPARWQWPGRLRSKWVAVGLLAIYLYSYEAFDLWDSPGRTAGIVIGYFIASFLVDGLFKGASFCKYVCPIGQFNFVQSLVSPLEVKVRDHERCRNCRTHECIRGGSERRGCELQLFQPKKEGNLDCTFCLDCVHACPHDNVGILAFVPASQLFHDRQRSSIGRFSQRPDLAALILLLVFGAFVNAAGMLEQTAAWEEMLKARLHLSSQQPVEIILFVVALLVVPLILTGLCGKISRALGTTQTGLRELICSFAVAFVPLGFSMWLAHLVFHFLSWPYALIPVAQRAAGDLGLSFLGKPDWASWSAGTPFAWLPSLQLLLLDAGFLLTLYTGWRIAQRFRARGASPLGLFAPWAGLAVGLYLIGIWIVFQPMQMRGAMVH